MGNSEEYVFFAENKTNEEKKSKTVQMVYLKVPRSSCILIRRLSELNWRVQFATRLLSEYEWSGISTLEFEARQMVYLHR